MFIFFPPLSNKEEDKARSQLGETDQGKAPLPCQTSAQPAPTLVWKQARPGMLKTALRTLTHRGRCVYKPPGRRVMPTQAPRLLLLPPPLPFPTKH